MELQNFNYHTHTQRCGHATGIEQEYADAAIQAGFQTLGFSEHCGYEGWDDPVERIPFLQMNQYFEDMQRLKKDYSNRLNIRIGVEFEFFEDSLDYLKEVKKSCDYMIVGQHAKNRQNYDYHYTCNDKDVRIMAKQVCRAIETGLANYVAHPDYFMLARKDFSKECAIAIEEIAQCAKQYNIPVEINLKGMRYGIREYPFGKSYIYPNTEVWKIISKVAPPVVFGYDAHSPHMLEDRSWENIARSFAEQMEITTLSTLNF